MPSVSALLLMSMAADHGTLVLHKAVTTADRLVQLSTVVDLSSLPPAQRKTAAHMVVARFNPSETRLHLSNRFIAQRMRAQMPALMKWHLEAKFDGVTVDLVPLVTDQVAPPDCLQAASGVEAGTVVEPANFTPVSCGPEAIAQATRYDAASRAVRAARRIESGETVKRFAGYGTIAATAGKPLTLQARVGNVVVAREVTALQSASRNQRLFVRTKDGTVMSVSLNGGGS